MNNIESLFVSYYDNKTQTIDEILSSEKINLIIKIFNETFTNYFNSYLNEFFGNIISSKILYCEQCINDPQTYYIDCLKYHNYANIQFSFDSLFQFFESVIKKEQAIKEKIKKISNHQKIKDFSLSQEIAFKNITNISNLIKLRLSILLEKFKTERNVNDPNIFISENIKQILKNLQLYPIYQNIISNFIKSEIDSGLSFYVFNHTQRFVNELISMFSDYFLEWAFFNNNLSELSHDLEQEKSEYKEKFITYLKQKFMTHKVDKFFDIISTYPNSAPTLADIKFCLSSYNQSEFVSKIKNQLSSRLLTPGISTRLIIEIFIRIIKIMKSIEPSSYLLEMISSPIKEYLRQRKDTMQWIVTTILNEDDDAIIMEDMNKVYVRNIKSQDYDYMSSDEEPENWEPVNTKGMSNNNITGNDFNNKMTDIISTLVNIFGSPEKFMEQYKRMLSERRITDNNFSLDNEIKNIELLKLKFGENLLQNCDVIIKDIKDSMKLNATDIKDDLISCLIVNKNYWPFITNNIFDINDLTQKTEKEIPYDKFLKHINAHLTKYKENFSKKKFSRNLNFYSDVGYVNLTLSFNNGSFDFIVSPLSAFIIKMFDEENEQYFKTFTIDFISDKLKAESEDVRKKINFWVTKGVLKEMNENGVIYYKPNEVFKNVENDVIVFEEDIYLFEYPVETANGKLIENSIVSIIKNSGPKNFEQLYKNLIMSYQLGISEIKLKDLLGKMTLEQKVFKEGENYKLIVAN